MERETRYSVREVAMFVSRKIDALHTSHTADMSLSVNKGMLQHAHIDAHANKINIDILKTIRK